MLGRPAPKQATLRIILVAVPAVLIVDKTALGLGLEGDRRGSIGSLAQGIAQALTQATPQQEVGAAAFPEDRRMGVFSTEKVTSFRVWFEGPTMMVEFFEIEAPYEESTHGGSYQIPLKPLRIDRHVSVRPGQGIQSRGRLTVAVDWRNPWFSRPVARGGKIRRRTILMDADEVVPGDGLDDEIQPMSAPADMTDAQVKAIDQAEAARRSGMISENEYQRRLDLIYQGKLEEAGY